MICFHACTWCRLFSDFFLWYWVSQNPHGFRGGFDVISYVH
nr:MAG TPA: hypothetical protein [Caudoviricetes sp.]